MGTKALLRGELGDSTVKILVSLQHEKGLSLRALSRESGIKLTRLGNILERGFSVTLDEISALADVFCKPVWVVIAAAEWLVYGEAPEGLSDDDVQAIESLLPQCTGVSAGEKCAPIPLFSDRDGDEFPAEVALPRMA